MLILVVGALTMSENLFGWDAGIDQLIARERGVTLGVESPNRMGLPASASFVLIGAALLILSRREASPRGLRVAQTAGAGVCAIATLPLVGYLYGAGDLYGIARFTAIAWPTAVGLLGLGVGLLCVRPDAGFMRLVTANDPGGAAIRRLLPGILLLSLLLGWLKVTGYRAGYFAPEMGAAMWTLLAMFCFVVLVYDSGRRVSRASAALLQKDREREMLLESERAARSEAQLANRMKDEFLATVSHELRTPLNAILGWSQLLSNNGGDAKLAQGIEVIQRNARAQARLIEDLLDMGRIISGKVRVEMHPVEMASVILAAVETVRPAAQARDIRLTHSLEPGATNAPQREKRFVGDAIVGNFADHLQRENNQRRSSRKC
jgi:signal transduction histidine kinase